MASASLLTTGVALVQRGRALPVGLVPAFAAALVSSAIDSRGLDGPGHPPIDVFLDAAGQDEKAAARALAQIDAAWQDGHGAILLDLARFMRPPRRGPGPAAGGLGLELAGVEAEVSSGRERTGLAVADPGAFGTGAGGPDGSTRVRDRLVRFLERRTGNRFGHDLKRWRQWLWSRPCAPHPDYVAFKSALYGRVDRRLSEFFPPGVRTSIRLDEVDWGGVGVNGIPPLDHPAHVTAREATWLGDAHVVFGISLNGETRAYPKRIIGWHELVRDRLGGVELTIAYCTLCGTVIPYGSVAGGRRRTLGTSGLLYRSNKLMFDEETMSLWSTAEGRPVVGPLAGSGLELEAYPVVTTKWREWRAAHPETTVLSLQTGHRRDYSEGAAYRAYFATDDLMFAVPRTDRRLRNKDEVLGLLVGPPEGGERRPLAIAESFLKRHTLHALSFAGRALVVLTTPDGANRVYDSGSVRLVRRLADGRGEDEHGGIWNVTEDALVATDGRRLPRLAARRAFWFGWFAQFPDTELVGGPR